MRKKMGLQLRIVIVPEVSEEARKNGAEMEKNRGKSGNCDFHVTCVDVFYFL